MTVYEQRDAAGRFVRQDDLDRFWRKVDKSGGPDACWIWQGWYFSYGYGGFDARGKSYQAHRYAFMVTRGAIPEGAVVCHNCPNGDNPRCVNPSHLWLGTQAENIHDRDSKGHTAQGERNGYARLTESLVLEMIAAHRSGERITHIARRLDLPQPTVYAAVLGKNWKYLRQS